jgi:hypothetical protein
VAEIRPEIAWTPSDAAGLDQFLSTQLGRKWLAEMLNRKPRGEIHKGLEHAALSGAFAAGYEQFFLEIYATRSSLPSADIEARSADMSKD